LCCKLKKKWCFVPFKKVKILVQFWSFCFMLYI
jgi:hypothetical protein